METLRMVVVVCCLVVGFLTPSEARTSCLLDTLAGKAICKYLEAGGERRERQLNLHHEIWPTDPVLVRDPACISKPTGEEYQPHPICEWPHKPTCHADLLRDPRFWDVRGMEVCSNPDSEKAYWETLDELMDEAQFVARVCKVDALRLPQNLPGEPENSPYPTIALSSNCQDCMEPSEDNLEAAELYDKLRCAQCRAPSLRAMLERDGPTVRKHLRALICFYRDIIRNIMH